MGAAELLFEAHLHAVHVTDAFGHMQRDADGARFLRERPGDGLSDPPGCVGGETVAACVVEFIDGAHQADIPFLDEVEEGHALVHVFLGDADDEPRVGAAEVFARFLPAPLFHHHALDGARRVPPPRLVQGIPALQFFLGAEAELDPPREFDFHLRGQQRFLRHLPEIQTDRIVRRDRFQVPQGRAEIRFHLQFMPVLELAIEWIELGFF